MFKLRRMTPTHEATSSRERGFLCWFSSGVLANASATCCATLLLLVTLSNMACSSARNTRPPNIILIYADDLGYGELGCYGQTRILTPHIDQLAADGARFTQFYSAAPVCAPSRAAMLTGLHLGHVGIRDNAEVQPEGQAPLAADATTLADDLKRAGYITACIGKWGLGFVGSTGDPNANGFDLFFGYNCQRQAHNYYPTHLWRNDQRVPLVGNDPTQRREIIFAPDLMLDEALAFIEHANESGDATPFFLAYTTTLPHMAMQPKATDVARYQGKFEETPYVSGKGYLPHATPRAGYAAMITRLDSEVGALCEVIRRSGDADNTIIILTSDNGPTHDVGGVDTQFFHSTASLRGRKGSVWEGGIRVPCIASWPRHIDAGRVIDTPAWTVDLRATLNAFARTTSDGETDGVNLVPLLLHSEPVAPRALYWPFAGYGGQQAVREGDWKIVRRSLDARAKKPNATPLTALEGWELFDLAHDPNETTDLASTHPEIVARLAAIATTEHTQSQTFPIPGVD